MFTAWLRQHGRSQEDGRSGNLAARGTSAVRGPLRSRVDIRGRLTPRCLLRECSDMKRILRLSATQTALAWLIGTYLIVTLRTIRWNLHGSDHLAPFAEGQIVIAAFWHERLALMPTLWMKARKIYPDKTVSIYMLVSRHRDGRLIGSILRKIWCASLPRIVIKGGRCEHATSDVAAAKWQASRHHPRWTTRSAPCGGSRRCAACGNVRSASAALLGTSIPTTRPAKLGSDGHPSSFLPRDFGVWGTNSRSPTRLGSVAPDHRPSADISGGARR